MRSFDYFRSCAVAVLLLVGAPSALLAHGGHGAVADPAMHAFVHVAPVVVQLAFVVTIVLAMRGSLGFRPRRR